MWRIHILGKTVPDVWTSLHLQVSPADKRLEKCLFSLEMQRRTAHSQLHFPVGTSQREMESGLFNFLAGCSFSPWRPRSVLRQQTSLGQRTEIKVLVWSFCREEIWKKKKFPGLDGGIETSLSTSGFLSSLFWFFKPFTTPTWVSASLTGFFFFFLKRTLIKLCRRIPVFLSLLFLFTASNHSSPYIPLLIISLTSSSCPPPFPLSSPHVLLSYILLSFVCGSSYLEAVAPGWMMSMELFNRWLM